MKKYFMIFMTLFALSTANVVMAEEAPSEETSEEKPKDSAEC